MYDNTGDVTTTNAARIRRAHDVCGPAHVTIMKTADASQVNAGDQIGFTVRSRTPARVTRRARASTIRCRRALARAELGDRRSDGYAGEVRPRWSQGQPDAQPRVVDDSRRADFTVHITATTSATGCGVLTTRRRDDDERGNSDPSSAKEVWRQAAIQIVKTADAAQVNPGEQIGFTVTVYNLGSGDAKGVKLNDPLPANTGLVVDDREPGRRLGGSCAIAAGTLNCGPVTVPAGTTQAASTFTVHITSPTTLRRAGFARTSGVVDNTGFVTTTNDGSDQSSASTCVQGVTDLQITKTGSPATQDVLERLPFQNITWTMVVTNNGPIVDTNVMVGDPMPAGNIYVSSTTTKGTCTGGVILSCNLGTMQVGDKVTIILVTTPTITGTQMNTATVAGDLPETNYDEQRGDRVRPRHRHPQAADVHRGAWSSRSSSTSAGRRRCTSRSRTTTRPWLECVSGSRARVPRHDPPVERGTGKITRRSSRRGPGS